MSLYTNENTFGMSSSRRDDQEHFDYYSSSLPQQNEPAMDDSSFMGSHYPHQMHMSTDVVFSTSSWPSTNFFDPSFEEIWSDRAGMNLGGMEIASPIPEQAFPVAQGWSPVLQPYSPPSWNQAPSPPLQHNDSWEYPAYISRPHGGLIPSVAPFQPAAPSVPTIHTEGTVTPTGAIPSNITNPAHLSANGDLASASSSTHQSRGERWDAGTETFPCMWTSGGALCTAVISGDRRSITNHLRDEHNFTCDGLTIACAWDRCMTPMQRRNIPRHIVSCHLGIKVPCPNCGMPLSRADANRKHQQVCTGGGALGAAEAT